jgi:radical SAM superfamily enzyme YgiQ (UPF0313 family)
MIGGPYASSEPEALLPLADHVVVGEPDEVFQEIAADLEVGAARRLYRSLVPSRVRVYITAWGCESELVGRGGLQAAGAGGL